MGFPSAQSDMFQHTVISTPVISSLVYLDVFQIEGMLKVFTVLGMGVVLKETNISEVFKIESRGSYICT